MQNAGIFGFAGIGSTSTRTTGGGGSGSAVDGIVVGTSALATLLAVQLLTTADPVGRCLLFFRQLGSQEKRLSCSQSVKKGIDDYSQLHQHGTQEEKTKMYSTLVNAYYDLATVFYEWGWCSSFHFSYRYPEMENFAESIRRHEYCLAAQLRVFGSAVKALDVGCGIGGPMRNISKFLGNANITGITLNPYQVQRGNELNQADKYSRHCCKILQGDFMKLPPAYHGSFDAAYAIEATCHAPDRISCYRQIYECLKPGAIFACYEWCMTDKYNPNDPVHVQMKKDIEAGNGLPDICDTNNCLQALQAAGFVLLHEQDLADTIPLVEPWETPLCPSWNPLSQRFQFNWLGGHLTNLAIWLLETVRIAPAGTAKTQQILQTGGFALRDASKAGIFTTMYLLVGQKPLDVSFATEK